MKPPSPVARSCWKQMVKMHSFIFGDKFSQWMIEPVWTSHVGCRWWISILITARLEPQTQLLFVCVYILISKKPFLYVSTCHHSNKNPSSRRRSQFLSNLKLKSLVGICAHVISWPPSLMHLQAVKACERRGVNMVNSKSTVITLEALLPLLPFCCSRGSALAETEGVCMIHMVTKLQKKQNNKKQKTKKPQSWILFLAPCRGREILMYNHDSHHSTRTPRCLVYVQPLKNSFKSLSWIVIVLHLHSD